MSTADTPDFEWLGVIVPQLQPYLNGFAAESYKKYGRGCVTMHANPHVGDGLPAGVPGKALGLKVGYLSIIDAHSVLDTDARVNGFMATYKPDCEFVLLAYVDDSNKLATSVVPFGPIDAFALVHGAPLPHPKGGAF